MQLYREVVCYTTVEGGIYSIACTIVPLELSNIQPVLEVWCPCGRFDFCIFWCRGGLTAWPFTGRKRMSANLFHSSLSVVIVRLWIRYSTGGDGYIFLFHLVLVLNHTDQFCPSWTPEEVLFWIFFWGGGSWRRFCVVHKIKGRMKEPCIKEDSKGEESWGKKDNEERNFRNLSCWVWMIQGHLQHLTLSSTLDFLKKTLSISCSQCEHLI